MTVDRSTLFAIVEKEVGAIFARARASLQDRAQLVHPELSSTAYLCLAVLREHPEGCPQSRVVDTLELDKGVVSRAVGDLERLGFVARTRDETDRRVHLLTLTEAAAQRLAEVAELRHEVFVARFDRWSDAELAELATLLERYNAAFQRQPVPAG